jgi:Fe-Mn family superoxide dismutase
MKNFCFLMILLTAFFHYPIEAEEVYKAKDYSYLLGRMKGFNDNLLSMHFKLYEGYVKNTNLLIQSLEDLKNKGDISGVAFGALKHRLGWEYDGMKLHELYFENLGGVKQISQTSALYQHLIKDFGSYEAWKKDFIATGLMRGIGWVVLYQDKIKNRLFNVWVNEHDVGHLAGGKLLVVMDVWEHAYITEYGLDRAKYINAFFDALDWTVVEKRY